MPLRSTKSDISESDPSPDLGTVRKTPRKRKFTYILSIAAVLLGIEILSLLPVRFPSAVSTYGRITPAHRWVLVRGTDGRLIASTFNYQTGLSEGYRVSNFDRGSSVSFSVHSSLIPGQVISRGDTIGSVYSSEMQEGLIALNGQLAAAKSLLAVNASGEKAAIVNEAQQRLQFSRRRKEEHQKVMLRSKRLFEAHLISQGEYEGVESEANLLNDEIHLAEANLEAARTGAKPEQLELAHANIVALENEIAAIKGRAASYTLTAPITGTISRVFSTDTLLIISGTTNYVALIPVKWKDYARVARTQDPRVTLWGVSKRIHGNVIALNREIQMLQGEKVVIATALLADSSEDLIPGMLTRCHIECQPVTALEYVKRLFASLTV